MASSLPFQVARVLGLLGCLWRNILSDILRFWKVDKTTLSPKRTLFIDKALQNYP